MRNLVCIQAPNNKHLTLVDVRSGLVLQDGIDLTLVYMLVRAASVLSALRPRFQSEDKNHQLGA